MAQTATRKCIFCDNIAIFFCYECKEAFCKQCKGKHDKLSSTKNHSMTDLKRVDLTQFKSAPDCSEHEMEYSYYCNRCRVLICNECVVNKHKGHDISSVKTIADTLRKSASNNISELKKRISSLSKSINKIKSEYLPKLNQEAQIIISSIKSTAEEVKKIVDWKAEIKIGDVADIEKSQETELQSSLATIERIFRSQDATCRSLEKLLTEEHAVTFFVSYQSLKNEIDMFDYGVDKVEPKHIPSASTKSFCDEIIQGINMHVQSCLANSPTEDRDVDVYKMDEHIVHARAHGHFVGYDENVAIPDEDDTKSSILSLLWTHQDYFDQKVLSRAQAEYNFYLVLKREWTKAMERLNIDDIQYGAFDIKQFYQLPRNRPLYAVILTIFEQSKDKSQAVAAAEEYFMLKILESSMRQQEIIKAIPPGIDIDDAHYNELFQNMKSRFKSSGSRAQQRQASEFKMVPLFEYLKLKETITQQRNQIEELASRLSGIASQQLAEVDAGFTDLGDKNRPQELGERFAELFDETWSSAYESLKSKKETQGDDDDNDEKTMELLQRIVKVIYEFCQRVSQEQITRIVFGMMLPIIDPMNVGGKKDNEAAAVTSASGQMKAKTEQIAREYRKVVAHATIKVLQKEIMKKEIKEKKLVDNVGKELDTYVQQCVDLIWCMCIQQPAMELVWATPGQKFNMEQFRFCGKKGKKYKFTVWPCVFLHKDGPLVAPGYAVPE